MKQAKKKQVKKGKKGSWITFAISVIIGGIIGFFCGMSGVSQYVDKGKDGVFFITVILEIFAALYVQIMIHEAGHLFFGLRSGYQFTSFRIGSFIWIKQEGHIALKRFSLMGTGGQCLMEPPEMINGEIPYRLYLAGGVLMNLISTIPAIILAIVFPDVHRLVQICIIFTGMGIMSALTNGIPLQAGPISNDAATILSLSKDQKARKTLWRELKMNALNAKGVRLQDMPEEWFEMPSPEEMKNPRCAVNAVYACNRVMEQMDFIKVTEMGTKLLEADSAIAPIHRYLLQGDLIFCELVDACRKEVADSYQTKEYKKYEKSMKKFPPLIRTQYAYELLINKDEEQAGKKLEYFNKIAKSYPYSVDIENEKKNIEYASSVYEARKGEKLV